MSSVLLLLSRFTDEEIAPVAQGCMAGGEVIRVTPELTFLGAAGLTLHSPCLSTRWDGAGVEHTRPTSGLGCLPELPQPLPLPLCQVLCLSQLTGCPHSNI